MVAPGKSKEQLRREAADWLARLGGEPSAADREAFERWRAADPAHDGAYRRLRGHWDDAALLGQTSLGRSHLPNPRRHWGSARPIGYAMAAMLLGMIAVAAYFSLAAGRPQPTALAGLAAASEASTMDLPDGSRVTLQAGAELSSVIGGEERRLTLHSGSARFFVAKDQRPFIVAAPGGTVVARGTVFDIAVTAGETRVHLLEGAVDVRIAREQGSGASAPRRLQPGQSLVLRRESVRGSAEEGAAPSLRQAAMLDFESSPLSEVVETANGHATRKIVLADAALGRLRLTGSFRVGDTPGLARSLAAMFDLDLEDSAGGDLVMSSGARRRE